MRIAENYSLEHHNTFRLPVKTRRFIAYKDEEELSRILRDNFFIEHPFLSIGEGSNILFVKDFDGTILHSRIKGIQVIDHSVILRIGAGEHWDDVVAYAVSKGRGGIENLSFIPGTVGAAAVQNIGAYGVEIKDVIETVETYNPVTCKKHLFTNEECRYGYRHSFFKDNPFIITAVSIRLQQPPQFKLDYGNLAEALEGQDITLQSVRDAIIKIRRDKLPDPAALGNAGSFFKNPVIPLSQIDELKRCNPSIPSYPASESSIKISAAWLIEQCGFKGKREGNVGIYDKQALILVNYGNATGAEILTFAQKIQQAVYGKFNIHLVPEVQIIES